MANPHATAGPSAVSSESKVANVFAASTPATPVVHGIASSGLVKRRKLALFLDIDHTIIHAIATKNIPYNLLTIMDDMFFFKLNNDPSDGSPIFCLVKMRPGLAHFLQSEIKDKLVQIVGEGVIQPQLIAREFFLSREDAFITPTPTRVIKKNLSAIIDLIRGEFDPAMAVIVDDRCDVWLDSDVANNLLKIHPYTFFVGMSPAASSTNFTGPLGLGHHLRMLEVPQINLSGHSLSDTCLHQMTKILAHIHRKFYEALDESCAASTSKTAMETTFNEKMSTVDSLPPNIHVQKYITRARQSVLHGVKLYLHGAARELRDLVELFGGQVAQDIIDDGITHIVTSRQEQQDLLQTLPKKVFDTLASKQHRYATSQDNSSDSELDDDQPTRQATTSRNALTQSCGAITSAPSSPKEIRQKRSVFLVSYNWIRESIKVWRRVPETAYLLAINSRSRGINGLSSNTF